MSDVVHGATDTQLSLLLSRLLHAAQENDRKLVQRGQCVSVVFSSPCGELEWTGASKTEGSGGPHANTAGAVTIIATDLQCTEFML